MKSNGVLLLAPTKGNGGINTWTRTYLKTFDSKNYSLFSIDTSLKHRSQSSNSIIKRVLAGLLDLRILRRDVKRALKEHHFAIMHATTSGSLGTLRDYVLGKICKRKGLKLVLHCRYGCIPEVLESKSFFSYFLLKTMRIYDQIWVLDSRTQRCLSNYNGLASKVFLTPNSIYVPETCYTPQTFRNLLFMGNLVPTKGLFELIEAVKKTKKDVVLSIVGPGADWVIQKIKDLAGDDLGRKICLIGPKINDEAVEFLKTQDILALPTYYKSEAFPISILEAMSYGKLVISTDRAAIPDMLTGIGGVKAGILVKEKCVDSIQQAIEWVVEHPKEAAQICKNAYQKVLKCYDKSVVYKIYENNYNILI